MNIATYQKISASLARFYLIYLGILPALATFAILWAYGYPWPFILFLVGVAAVGIYLATIMSYTPIPKSLPWLLLALLDGPLFVLISLRSNLHPLAFAIEGYLIDGTAIWLSILFLAGISDLPTRGQRVASITILVLILGMTMSLFWPYWKDFLWGNWERSTWLLLGIIQATWLNFGRFQREEILRQENDGGILFVVGLLFLWLIAMFAGIGIHESGITF